MRDAVAGELTSTGWIDWAGVLAMLGKDQCLWVDLGGVHHGPTPARLPVGATHLWSWRPDRWTRVRFDGDRALATVLTAGSNPQGEPVTARTSEGLPWGQHSRAAEWEHRVTLVVTEGSAPITFVKVPPASGGPC
ncbi:MAG TPA: hypothetical protein VIY28_06235 [Pseudonocardiaceae bacterium]